MKKLLKLFFICGCLGIASSALAGRSSLEITNFASDTNVEISVDLLCGSNIYKYPSSYRYTSTLKENPIIVNQTKKAIWENCLIARKEFFNNTSDHSLIYVTLKDLRSDEYAKYAFHVLSGKQTKPIAFAGRNYTVTMAHIGEYRTNIDGPFITSTSTQMVVDG